MDPGELRNLKDFLLLYNQLSQKCFTRCIYDMGQRQIRSDELGCIDRCISKNIHVNQRLMGSYVEINPEFQERKLKEQQAELEEQLKKNPQPSPPVPVSEPSIAPPIPETDSSVPEASTTSS